MKKFLSNLFGVGDEVSSKRVVGIVGAFTLFVTMFVNSFFDHNIAPSKELVDAVQYITIAMFGFTSIDKFSKK
jgi:hypothetical protein